MRGKFLFEFCQQLSKAGTCVKNLLVVSFTKAGSLQDHFLTHAFPAQLILGGVFRITAQHDVGAAPCHVGGNRHRCEMTGLGYDLGFFFMIFGI